MLSFIRMTFMIVIFGLISTMALGQGEDEGDAREEARDWGYIRIDNRSGTILKTNCYDEGGGGRGWKTTYVRQFRSCHGDYMRVDVVAGKTMRFHRKNFNCGHNGLYITLSGPADDIKKEFMCK